MQRPFGGPTEAVKDGLHWPMTSRSIRNVSPPVLPPPPPDLSSVAVSSALPSHPNVKPCFSEKTRDLFRQKLLIRKRNLRPPVDRPTQLDLTKSFSTIGAAHKDFKKSATIRRSLLNYSRQLSYSPTTDQAEGSNFLNMESSEDITTARGPQHHQSQLWQQKDEIEIGGDCEAIPLPQTESIPQQNWTLACGWIPIVGRDIVACLFSRDWELRESSMRRLSREVANALTVSNVSESSLQEAMLADKLDRIWRCTADMIARAAEDKVFKVYWAALKAMKTLVAFAHFTRDANYVRNGIKPIVQSILLKCADGQKRMAELSLQTIADLCSNQTFMVGNCGQIQRLPTLQLEGLDFVFQLILEEKDSSWQYALGRLSALDYLLANGFHVQIQHLLLALEFTFQNLTNSHSRVAKTAFKVFVTAAKLVTFKEPMAFDQIWNLTLTLNPTLQLLLRKKLKAAILTLPPMILDLVRNILEGHNEGLSPTSHQNSLATVSNIQPLIRSTSNSPSRSPPTNTSNSIQRPKKTKRATPYSKSKPLKSNSDRKLKKPPDYNHPPTIHNHGATIDFNRQQQQQQHCWTFQNNEPQQDSFNTASEPCAESCKIQHQGNLILPYVPSLMPHRTWQTRLQNKYKDDPFAIYTSSSAQYGYLEGQQWTKSFMLGSGAFSTCYQARDVLSGTLMAVKQIPLNRVQDEDEKTKLVALIREEVDLMNQLDHPNILRLFGVVQEDAQLNVFVEWMAGGSIARLLDKHGAFNEGVIIKYSQQILVGLDYLHSLGILHRDLKGANLFVDNTGHHLRIGDFGAAAHLYSHITYPGEFRGQLQGTVAFMAPEVLRGESYGRSCDIWSVGCCIIEMATAKAPWNASDISNYYCLMYKIACSPEPPGIPFHLSSSLQNLASRCLQLIPLQRPQAKNLLSHPVFLD